MWKPEHRRAADRRGMRYPSDLTDAEWALVEPMIPAAKHGGRKRTVDVREVLNGIFYVLATGCQWNAVPTDLPPKSTIYDYLDLWDWDGTLERIHFALYLAVREQAAREASPTVTIIDAQSAKGAQKGGLRSIRRAMTRAKRSKVASGTSSSIRSASCSTSSSTRPTCKIAMALHSSLIGARAACFRSSSGSSPTLAIKDRSWHAQSPRPEPGPLKSSSATNCIASSFSPNAGSSSAPLPGSAAAVASPKTSSVTPAKPPPSSASP